MTPPPPMEYVCSGCGTQAPATSPFRCPRASEGRDVDHVLTRRLDPQGLGPLDLHGENPFLRFKKLLHPWHLARSLGLSGEAHDDLVGRLQDELLTIAGVGFETTPCAPCPALAHELGLGKDQLWIKNETVGVAGSHKARHLMPALLHLKIMELAAGEVVGDSRPPLAIASCGNAALAAATLARAARRRLLVFVPEAAPDTILARIRDLDGEITICGRRHGQTGDPCYAQFQAALARGAQPFCCQGPDCALNIEGGSTLIWELIDSLQEQGRGLDELIVQVGGGALAAACMRGLEEACNLGILQGPPPRIHVVQTEGAAPLPRALARMRSEPPLAAAGCGPVAPEVLQQVLHAAARHRSHFMWPWETEPRSLATGILDDETHDWLAVLRGLLMFGGQALTVAEPTIEQAWKLGRATTGSNVSPTGTAGLAGLLDLREQGLLAPSASVGIIFTGAQP